MLYVVSTPIGNLKDITLRALDILKESNYVLAEDTRRTGKLLHHYEIKNKLVSYNDKSKARKTPSIIEDLKHGKKICIVSDAGTPGISDPGFYLIREAIKNNVQIVPIPGPSSLLAAVVCSGLPTDRFTFYGFFPKKNSKKETLLEEINERGETAIFFESPYRIHKTTKLLVEKLPDAEVVIARELTKKFEEFIRGNSKEVYGEIQDKKLKGEITIIINVGI